MNIALMFLFASTCSLREQEIWQRKNEKNISRIGGSTEIIGIFTFARKPFRDRRSRYIDFTARSLRQRANR